MQFISSQLLINTHISLNMSASSRTFYAPIFFPLANVISAFNLPWDEVVETKKKIFGSLNITGYLTLVATAVRSAILAYIAMYWSTDYPAFGSGKNIEFGQKKLDLFVLFYRHVFQVGS